MENSSVESVNSAETTEPRKRSSSMLQRTMDPPMMDSPPTSQWHGLYFSARQAGEKYRELMRQMEGTLTIEREVNRDLIKMMCTGGEERPQRGADKGEEAVHKRLRDFNFHWAHRRFDRILDENVRLHDLLDNAQRENNQLVERVKLLKLSLDWAMEAKASLAKKLQYQMESEDKSWRKELEIEKELRLSRYAQLQQVQKELWSAQKREELKERKTEQFFTLACYYRNRLLSVGLKPGQDFDTFLKGEEARRETERQQRKQRNLFTKPADATGEEGDSAGIAVTKVQDPPKLTSSVESGKETKKPAKAAPKRKLEPAKAAQPAKATQPPKTTPGMPSLLASLLHSPVKAEGKGVEEGCGDAGAKKMHQLQRIVTATTGLDSEEPTTSAQALTAVGREEQVGGEEHGATAGKEMEEWTVLDETMLGSPISDN